MNTKTTLGLLIVAIIVGALIYFAPRRAGEPVATPKPATPTGKNLFDPAISIDAVTNIELEQPGKPKLVFERVAREPNAPTTAQAEYRMLEPIAGASEGWVVRGVVSAIAGLQTREQFEPGKDGQPSLAEAGLEPPAAIVRLTDEAGKTYVVEVGRKVVMSEDTYVRRGGESAVHVVKNDLLQQVRKEVGDFRSKKLLDFVTDHAVALAIEHEGRKYELTRVENFDWTISSPVAAYADREKVRQLLTKLMQLRADEFVSDAPASLAMYGLEQPYLSIELITEHVPPPPAEGDKPAVPQAAVSRTFRILFGGPAGVSGDKRYVKLADAPWVANIAEATVKGLVPNLKELRDARVTRVRAGDVRKLEITSGGQTAVVERGDEGWKGVSGVSDLDQTAVGELLAALEAIRAIDYVDDHKGDVRAADAPFGLARPRATIRLTAAGLIEPLTLRIGAATATGRNAYLQRNDETSVIVAAEAQAEKLAVGVLGLRSREILNLSPEAIRSLELMRDGFAVRVARDADTWKLVQPADAPLNLLATGALVTNLARLRASRILDADEARGLAFDKPAAVIRLDATQMEATVGPETRPSDGPVKRYELRLTRKDGAGFARLDDDEALAYELDPSVFSTLTAELLEPRIFDFEPNSIAAVEIRSARSELALKRAAGGWQYAPDPYVTLDATKVNQVIDAVAKLKAEAFSAWSDARLEELGLGEQAPAAVVVTLNDATKAIVRFRPQADESCARIGGLAGSGRVFRISTADCEALFKSLDDVLKSETPAAPPPPRPAMPPPP